MNTITAINPAYQVAINRMYNADRKYNALVDANDLIESTSEFDYCEDDKAWRQGMRKQEQAYDQFTTYWDNLPKREQSNYESQSVNALYL